MRREYAADEAPWFSFRRSFRRRDGSRRRRTWHVVLVDRDHEAINDDARHDYGCTDYETSTIYIDASASKASIEDTVVHEIGHSCLDEDWPRRVRYSDYTREIEEALVRAMTPVFCRVLRPRFPPFPPDARALLASARRKARAAC